jgi:RimJ/RimL family protein N-acetyltransferase
LYDLRLRTPALELRLPTEDELAKLCAVAKAGIHDPATMPFEVAWTDKPSPRFEREFLQHHWALRAQWSPQRWTLALAVFRTGKPVGFQDLGADSFPVLREVSTGSWLGQAFQGQGYGKQMRAAVLHLAFAELGAMAANSGALCDNASSRAVSRALGYQENGVARIAPRGEPQDRINLRLTREQWYACRHCPVEVAGLDSGRGMFGG